MDKGSSFLVEEMESFESEDSLTVKENLSSDEPEIEPSYEEDEHVAAEKHMDPGLYLAAINGDLYPFRRILNQISTGDSEDDILSSLNPVGNTFLHVAAKHGNRDIVKSIASAKPLLVLAKNFNGETVLHLTAKGGDGLMVKALLEILSHNETEKRNLLRAENEMGNTALHQALLSGWESIASFLVKQDSELSYHQNNLGESAIYLAAKAGFVECVSSILAQCTDESRLNLLFKNKSPIQAPIERNNIVVLETMIKERPRLITMRNNEGRNPLHFAASLGNLEATKCLLKLDAFNATRRDKRGRVPIHLAALEGHVDIVRFLLENFPEAEALLDMSGCNILHIAAQSGRYNVFRFVLKNPKFDSLINMKDKFGNTPLHTACNNYHPNIVSTLTRDKSVDISAVNNEGMTALDVAYANNSDNIPLRQRLTWAALKAASVPQHFSNREDSAARTVNAHANAHNGRVNALLVVATLVATVTFAAGFTMPGGYISSENGTDLGMAAMWRHTVFHIFVLCDTIAMYTTSFVVVTALIWAKLGDNTLVLIALDLAAPLLGFALIMMSTAFTAGFITVVTKLRWLQIALFAMGIMGISFIALLRMLLLPLCASLTSRCQILRYLSYYPFRLLVLLSYLQRNH